MLDKTTVAFAKVMKMNPDSINPDVGINFMGVDSLISVEVGRAIKTSLGVDLSIMELLNGPSLKQLSEIILSRIESHLVGVVEN